jgi:hypothetical protein
MADLDVAFATLDYDHGERFQKLRRGRANSERPRATRASPRHSWIRRLREAGHVELPEIS